MLTLALGVGVTIAMYSVVHATLVRPLPYPDPDRIVAVLPETQQGAWHGSSFELVEALRASKAFDAVTATLGSNGRLLGAGEPEDVMGFAVDASFFRVMTPPALGHPFRDDETDAIVLTHEYWQRRFNGDPAVIGRTVTIEPEPVRIVGVMPPGLTFGIDPAFLRAIKPEWLGRGEDGPGAFEAFARIPRDVTAAEAQARTDVLMSRLRTEHPAGYKGYRLHLLPLHRFLFWELDTLLMLLLGAVGFVLLIACANVSTLLMVRATARERDAAVRASLGASRWRLVRQQVVEAIALAIPATILGVLLATGVLAGILRLVPPVYPRIGEARVDAVIAAIATGVTVLTATVASLWPAFAASRANVTSLLARTSHQASRRDRVSLGSLIGVEVALSMALVAGAGVLALSLYRVSSVETGFDADGLITAGLNPGARYRDDLRRGAFYADVVEQVAAIPGTRGVTLSTLAPLSVSATRGSIDVNAARIDPGNQPLNIRWRAVLPSYFEVVGIPLVRGRGFDRRDAFGATVAVILAESGLALFPRGVDPVGRRVTVRLYARELDAEVVGIARNVRSYVWREPQPEMYVSAIQVPPPSASLVVAADVPATLLAAAIVNAVRRVDPLQPVRRIENLSAEIGRQTLWLRIRTTLVGAFSLSGLVLAVVGLWTVSAYAVVRRTREIGIRVALGARRAQVVRMLLQHAAIPVALGMAAGLLLAFNLSWLLEGWLFGVTATDARVYAAIGGLFALIALVATLIPAARAARIDPAVTLRAE